MYTTARCRCLGLVFLLLALLPSPFADGWTVSDPSTLGLNAKAIEQYQRLIQYGVDLSFA